MEGADALENCRLFAAQHRSEPWAQEILRFCAEGGATGSPLRAEAAPTEADLWARIHRLEADAEGPDGYATWKDAAIAERRLRVQMAGQVIATIRRSEKAEAGCAKGDVMHDEWIEEIASQWDGCMYDAGPGGEIDIGAAIRSAWDKRRTLQPISHQEPAIDWTLQTR